MSIKECMSRVCRFIFNVNVVITFWQMTYDNKRSVYACLNYGEAFCHEKINDRSICIDGDIGEILSQLKEK